MHAVLKKIILVVVLGFALIGALFTAVFVGMQFGLLNVRGSASDRNAFFFNGSATSTIPAQPCTDAAAHTCAWNETPEWAVIRGGLTKDAPVIAKVSSQTGVPARMIAAVVIPEQTRFFTSNREVFKHYFEPLKILGSLSQFSLGVSGIKEETAAGIERNAADPNSPLYPGSGYAALLTYATTTPHDAALFARLTDAHDHYYSYLYTALYIKEVEMQWQRAGFDIANNAGIVATLFNLGFGASHPHADPQIAGAGITTGGQTIVYGELASLFYNSSELTDIFPH